MKIKILHKTAWVLRVKIHKKSIIIEMEANLETIRMDSDRDHILTRIINSNLSKISIN